MRLIQLSFTAAAVACALSAQNSISRQPIIDMHVHAAMSMGGQPACANTSAFLASDPAQKEDRFGWKPVACANPLLPAKAPQLYEKEVLAEMERLNVTAVVMGDEK